MPLDGAPVDGADPNATFCDQQHAGAIACADFEDGLIPSGWAISPDYDGGAIDGAGYAGSRSSLEVRGGANTSKPGSFLFRRLDPPPAGKTLHLQAHVKVIAYATSAYPSTVVRLQLAQSVTIDLRVTDKEFQIHASHGDGTSNDQVRDVTLNQWQFIHLRWLVGEKATVTIDSQQAAEAQFPEPVDTPLVMLGGWMPSAPLSTTALADVALDDVLVYVE